MTWHALLKKKVGAAVPSAYLSVFVIYIPAAATGQTHVLDSWGKPIPGVLVQRVEPNSLQLPPSSEQWTTISTTGSDGKFYSDPDTTKSFVILSRDGFATLALDGQKQLEGEVSLSAGNAIAGTVVDEQGTSVTDALIGPFHPILQVEDPDVAPPILTPVRPPLWTRSDSVGQFRMQGLSSELHGFGFLVQASGFSPQMVIRPTGADTSITLSTTGTTWTGVLLGSRDHLPQSGIYVEASSGNLRLYSLTGPMGEFTFPLLPGDRWRFRTSPSPAIRAKAAMVARKSRKGTGDEIILLHNQGVTIGGNVRDVITSSPIQNMTLHLDAFQGDDALTTSSDENGNFRFENVDAFCAPMLRFDGYVSRTVADTYWSEVPISTMSGEDNTTLSYGLLSRVSVRGRVIGPGKSLVPEVQIAFILRKTAEPGFDDMSGKVKYQAVSKASGDFEAVLFPPGSYEVRTTSLNLASEPLTYDASTSRPANLDIHLKPVMTLRGRTLDAEGSPLAESRVDMTTIANASETSAPPSRLVKSIRSDAQGIFAMEGIFPEDVLLTATHPSSDDIVTTEVAIRNVPSTGGVDLRFPPGKLFSARVLDEQGLPLPGVLVQVYADQGRESESSATKLLSRRTDAEGRAVFALHAPRLQKVSARKQGFAPFHSEAVTLPRQDYEIRLRPRPSLSVKLAAQADGSPQNVPSPDPQPIVGLMRANQDVGQQALSGFFMNIRSQEAVDGEISFKNLEPGWYKAGTASGSIYSETEAVEIKADSGEIKVELPLAGSGNVGGRITDKESGEPIQGAEITLELPCCTPATAFESDPAQSDAAGRYELTGLPPASLLLTVKHPDYPQKAVTVKIPSSGTVSVDVELDHGGSVLSGLITIDGKPLPNALVYIYRPSNRNDYVEGGVTGPDGRYEIEGVPEGNHSLVAQALWGKEEMELRRSVEFKIQGPETVVNVAFRGLVRVSGSLRMDPSDESPTLFSELIFASRPAPEDLALAYRSAPVSIDGNYEIHLESGSYTVGLQEGPGLPLEVPDGVASFDAHFELRDLAQASGVRLIPVGGHDEPRNGPPL